MKPARLYYHPDGEGEIRHIPGALICGNDNTFTGTRIAIGALGLIELGRQLIALGNAGSGEHTPADLPAIVKLKSDLELIASGWRTDIVTARMTGGGIQFDPDDAENAAELLIEAADAIGALLRERGTPAPNTERV